MASAATVTPKASPPLNIPSSASTVKVSILNTTCDILCPASAFVKPKIRGQEYLNFPTFCFLIEHEGQGKKILFDAGGRKDWWNLSKVYDELFKAKIPGVKIEKGVDEVLREGGVDLERVGSVVWSHWHWDHTGDMSLFPSSTEVVVGPGFKKEFMPGYPTKQDSPMLDTDFKGRDVREIAFDDGLRIGDFGAYDFFGDGSFYLLDTPGHAQGHISGLARTTEDTFVFMGGDICHYGGAYRPTEYAPLPSEIPTSVPLDSRLLKPCPCSTFTPCHPNQKASRTTPFYQISDAPESWYNFPIPAQKSVDSLQAFDAAPNILVCIAHDVGLLPVLGFFPKHTINDWQAKGWKEATAWGFVNELPVDGKPGRPMIVDGLYRDGKIVGGGPEVLKAYS